MIHIIDTEEIEENGIIYIIEHYSNGGTVKYPKPDPDFVPPPDYSADMIDEGYEAQLEQQMNIQYLVDIAEINMEG